MKKLFVAVLAIAAVVACNKEQTVATIGPAAIAFEGASVDKATRANAAVDPSTTTTSINAFNVWGFMLTQDGPGQVFDAEDVTKSGNTWGYANTQYWLPGYTYYFAALAPMDSANWVLTPATAEADLKLGLGVVEFTNVDGTEDLLYSAVSVEGPEATATTVDPVKFTFNHLLSKVKFTFTNGFSNELATIDVKNVRMVVPAKASINLAQADWWSTNQWANYDGTVELAFGDACAKTAIGVSQEAANERLTIPAGTEQTYQVLFDVVLYQGDVVALEVPNKTATIEGVALEIGKAYNFSAELNASNITADGSELLPIEFEVVEVKEWVEAPAAAGVIGGAVENQTLFADAEATATVNLAGTLDGAGHTLSAVAGVNYVINNTARLVEATAPATISNLTIDGKGVYTDKYGIRGIYTIGTGDVKVENVEIVNCTYAINANNAGKLTVVNSTLQGWNSYGSTTETHFENVNFVDGEFHNFRPYNNAVLVNCDFAEGVVIDLSCLVEGATVKFVGCTYNGQPLTSANLSDAEGKNVSIDYVVTEAPESNALVGNASASNMTIDGGNFTTTDGKGLRAIYITKGGEYAYDNVVAQNVAYALNVNTTQTVTLAVTNSTLEGWVSYGGSTTATFKNVKFTVGDYYEAPANSFSSNDNGLFRPYGTTVCKDCAFEAGYVIDLGQLADGALTLENCTYDGVVLTEENAASVARFDNYDAAKLAW
ncbi:MAG: fimbrillin family protein [Alistipes sp.]|nr:fimbrillin family protein [Alistipes sp.]